MSDPSPSRAPSAADAAVAVAWLGRTSTDLRGCVILDPQAAPLAASGELETWGTAGSELLAAADAAAGEPVAHAHIGTEDGEAFVLRLGGYAIVAASERFALASLMLSDMRAALRDLLRGAVGAAAPVDAARAA